MASSEAWLRTGQPHLTIAVVIVDLNERNRVAPVKTPGKIRVIPHKGILEIVDKKL